MLQLNGSLEIKQSAQANGQHAAEPGFSQVCLMIPPIFCPFYPTKQLGAIVKRSTTKNAAIKQKLKHIIKS